MHTERESNLSYKTVSVIGLGYIGLPTAAILASRGVQVIGIDVNENAVNTINQGNIHIVEPDLDVAVHSTVTTGKLRATLKPEPAEAFIIAVPTPFKDNREPDLTYVHAASQSIALVLKKGNLVILESTSPVGTTEQLSRWLAELRPDLKFPHQLVDKNDIPDIYMAYCPERVLPGKVLQELIENDRIVGGMTSECSKMAQRLYKTFVRGTCFLTNSRTAEMAKLTENAFRDVNIAFANELSLICDKSGIDVFELIELANRHPRVNILQPGPGVGGHCIAVDPWFIVHQAPDYAKLIRTARIVNDSKPHWVLEKVYSAIRSMPSPKIACLGLAFKADIDDLRESPSLEIASELANHLDGRGELLIVEPFVSKLPPQLSEKRGVQLTTLNDALEKADVVLLLVNHSAFGEINRELLQKKIVIDTRGIFRERRQRVK